jgi:heme oxygenase
VPATSWSGPAFEGAAAALGALYVLEGSTLGGRVLAGRARAVLGDDVPVAFLTTGGADVPARWAATRALLAAGLATDDDQCRAAAAAAAVFDVFVEVLLP